jgi:hypothetical protein
MESRRNIFVNMFYLAGKLSAKMGLCELSRKLLCHERRFLYNQETGKLENGSLLFSCLVGVAEKESELPW